MSLSDLVADLKGLVSSPPQTTPNNISVAHMFNAKQQPPTTPTTSAASASSSSSSTIYVIYFAIAAAVIGVLVFVFLSRKKQPPQTTTKPQAPGKSGGGTSTSAAAAAPKGHARVHFDNRIRQQEYEPEDAPIEVRSGSSEFVGIEGGTDEGEEEYSQPQPQQPTTSPMIPIEGTDVWG